MRSKRAIYAIYQGDELVMSGTSEECAEVLGIKVRSLIHKAWKTKAKLYNSKFDVVRIGDVKDEMSDMW